MRRVTIASLLLIGSLLCAPVAAQAQWPAPTVSTAYGTVTPSFLSGNVAPRYGGGPLTIGDGFGINQPTLLAESGTAVTIKLARAVDAVAAYLGPTALAVSPVDAVTYSVTVPSDAPLPARFVLGLSLTTDTSLISDGWILTLDRHVADPLPTLLPTAPPIAAPGPDPAAALGARTATVRAAALQHLQRQRAGHLRAVATAVSATTAARLR
jgi:hypothetical protein